MFGWLVLVFIFVPLADLALLIKVGAVLHFFPTVALVITTGILGAGLARRQGLRTFATINSELASGHMPTDQLIEGLMILLAGAVLITPGFLTDLMGLALLIPPVRRVFRAALVRHFESRIAARQIQVSSTFKCEEPDPPMGAGFDNGPGSTPRPVKYVKNEALDQ